MLSRAPPVVRSTPTDTATLALPGLVSSLRPIKRISAQLEDELNLIHRFSYKNKNQHKSSAWWKKVIHVDRTVHRTLEEVQSLLSRFGLSKNSDELPTLGSEQVVAGLLQLPRSLILVEKSIQVLLSCAGILEQLIETKAFLAFVLVVVSLIARIHSLSLVLHDELGKLSAVLLHLVETNHLSEVVAPLTARLPRQLRQHISSNKPLAPQPRVSSTRTSISASPFSQDPTSPVEAAILVPKGDDLGDVVARKPKKEDRLDPKETLHSASQKKRPLPPVSTATEYRSNQTIDSESKRALSPPPKKKKTREEAFDNILGPRSLEYKVDRTAGILAQSETKQKRATSGAGMDALPKSRSRAVEGKEDQVKKKKKKPRKSMDEIDAIFG